MSHPTPKMTAPNVVFFQAYMVAPLIPRLATLFGVEAQAVGLVVPAYLIPYGVATLFYGLLADRLGPPRILLGSLLAFVVLTALTATASSAQALVGWRLVTGLGASGVVPMALVLVSKRFAYAERGRALGWLFGAMAGGSAFGSTLGVLLEPYLGWRALFLGVAAAGAVVWFVVRRSLVPAPGAAVPPRSTPGHRAGAGGLRPAGLPAGALHRAVGRPLGPALADSGRAGH